MKVLLIGSDIFVAKSLANRFLLEEDQIYLLGEFKAEEIDEIPEKIKLFNTNIAGEGAADVFRVQLPEVVIYFDNAQKDFMHDMVLDSVNDHMNRFMNAFALATWHDVRRFLYISTTDLYESVVAYPSEESLIKAESTWESAHYLCEQHLRNMDYTSKIFSLALRVSTLFGPGQKPDNSQIAYLVDQSSETKNGTNGDMKGTEEIDYLYIDDFCDAVYRAARSTITGVLNIASGKMATAASVKTVISKLKANKSAMIGFMEGRDSVDITLASTVMDFITHVDIPKGIRNMLLYQEEEKQREKHMPFSARIKRYFSRIGQNIKQTNDSIRLLPFVENLAAFVLVAYLVLMKDITMLFGFIDIRVLYILIIGAIFGLRQSLLSTALCVSLVFYTAIAQGYDFQSLLYDSRVMASLFVFLLAGLIFGYISDRARQREHELMRSEAKTQKQLAHIKEMYLESLKVKDVLQGQIFNTSNSYGRVFDMVYKLDSLDFNKLKGEIIRVTEEIMENRAVSLYMFGRNRGFLRLMAKSQGLRTAPKSINVKQSPEIQEILTDRQLYVRHEIGSHGDIIMAAPIENEDDVIAILVIHEAELSQLSLSYQNLFKITASLVSQSIERAYRYQQAQEDEWYIGDTNILKKEYLKERILQSHALEEQGVSSYVLLHVLNKNVDEISEKVTRMIREFDYVGLNDDGTLSILLNNTAQSEARYVLTRLESNGIDAEISEKVV